MKHSAPFWSWNGDLTAVELKRQMRYLKRMGMGGVFMHARTGLQTKYLSKRWFDLTRACIDEGKKLGLATWLYDEDRWPSGYAGGFVTRHKKYRLQWIYLDEHKENIPPAPGKKLRDFCIDGRKISFTHDTATTSNWYNGFCYVNVLDHFQCDSFGKEDTYVLPLNNQIREKLGLPLRNWDMVQPWAEKKRPSLPAERFLLRTSFESELQELPLEIALEDPGFNIPCLNGIPGTLCKGKWFLDKAFKICKFPAEALKKGINSLEIEVRYNEKHPGLEAVYLLGDFAVSPQGKKIFPLPEKLRCGDMTLQGLPFFCGSVKCRFEYTPLSLPAKLVLPPFAGALVRVKVSGKKAGIIWHAPLELDITPWLKSRKKAVIELELVNSPRNMLGPFYCSQEYVAGDPQNFMLTETKEKQLDPLGFMESFL